MVQFTETTGGKTISIKLDHRPGRQKNGNPDVFHDRHLSNWWDLRPVQGTWSRLDALFERFRRKPMRITM